MSAPPAIPAFPSAGAPPAGVDLWWIPLGAGGRFVRLNGRVYELVQALRQRRPRLDLYHAALVVRAPEGRYVIENAWPIPDAHGASRGVVVEGPVFSRRLARLRALRYEVRRWPDGVIFDTAWAVDSPRRLDGGDALARRVLDLAPSVPPHVWGRDERRTGEMWNSNSVVAWLLARAGARVDEILPPDRGRAPGWAAGVAVARAETPPADDPPRTTGGAGAARFGTSSENPLGARPTGLCSPRRPRRRGTRGQG